MELQVIGCDRPALIDDDLEHLARYRWTLDREGYVQRRSGGKRVYLHHAVLPGDRYPEMVRDHISRDKLDNRTRNLRWVSMAESVQNRGAAKRNATGERGVTSCRGRFLARVQRGGKTIARAWFDDVEEAKAFLDEVRPSILPFSG